jgi:hypothetical protein
MGKSSVKNGFFLLEIEINLQSKKQGLEVAEA